MIVSSWRIEPQFGNGFFAVNCISAETLWDSSFEGIVERLPRPVNVSMGGLWLRVPVQGEPHRIEPPILAQRHNKVHNKLLSRVMGGRIRRFPRRWLKKDAELVDVSCDASIPGLMNKSLRERMRSENMNEEFLVHRMEAVQRNILNATRSINNAVLPNSPAVSIRQRVLTEIREGLR